MTSAIAYRGRHAEIYDRLYSGKPYRDEARFVERHFSRHGVAPPSRIVDLACGTGSHALALAQIGYDVTGIDNSPDMIAVARSKAGGASARARFLEDDMARFDRVEGAFDGAICLFNSIGYLRTDEAIASALARTSALLRGEGVLMVEFWQAAAMLDRYDPLRVRRLETNDGETVRVAETTLDRAAGLANVRYSIYDLRADGTFSRYDETQVNRFFTKEDMGGLLAAAGFEPIAWFAGLSDSAPLDDRSFSLAVLARKAPGRAP